MSLKRDETYNRYVVTIRFFIEDLNRTGAPYVAFSDDIEEAKAIAEKYLNQKGNPK